MNAIAGEDRRERSAFDVAAALALLGRFARDIARTFASPHPSGVRGECSLPALAIGALVAIAGARASAADAPHAPAPDIDWTTSPLDLDLRGMNGERYTFRCAPGKPLPSRVAGSGPYTDDSSICTAAVHAGAIRAKDGGLVTIEIRPGASSYAASERNFIRTRAERAWSGSFVVPGNGAASTP